MSGYLNHPSEFYALFRKELKNNNNNYLIGCYNERMKYYIR